MKKAIPSFIISGIAGIKEAQGHDISASILFLTAMIVLIYIDFRKEK